VKQITTHGTVLSKEGEHFASRQNTISGYRPDQLQYIVGTDTFRLWAYSTADVDRQTMDPSFYAYKNKYRELRKFVKFMLDNLIDFDPKYMRAGRLSMTDAMIISQVYKKTLKIKECYDKNDVSSACILMVSFLYYLDAEVYPVIATRNRLITELIYNLVPIYNSQVF